MPGEQDSKFAQRLTWQHAASTSHCAITFGETDWQANPRNSWAVPAQVEPHSWAVPAQVENPALTVYVLSTEQAATETGSQHDDTQGGLTMLYVVRSHLCDRAKSSHAVLCH